MSKELIQIEHNIDAAQKKLTRLMGKVGTIEPALKGIGDYLQSATDKRFTDETGPDGKKWVDVKPSTRKKKRNTKILTEQGETGGLRGRINHQVANNTLLLGTDSPYGAIHQLGGEIKQEGVTLHLSGTGRNTRFAKKGKGDRTKQVNRTIKMPARPYLGVSKADEKEVVLIIGDYLKL